jgi:SAM-dependent methyltransferase
MAESAGPLTDPVAIARLRAALDRAGFTEAAVLRLLELDELSTDRRLALSLPLYLARTRQSSALATLVRLFVLGQPVSPTAAMDALAGDASGLLHASPVGIRATLQIIPFQDLLIAADWTDSASAIAEPVMGVAASTRALAQMMIPRRVDRMLDLGAGSGVLGLLAARYVGHVDAVDLNPRAADIARFNATLNGIANLTAHDGDLFAPVHDQTYDLIVCNPPFVIAPVAGRMHSQSGQPADDLLRSIIRAAPQYLRSGGYCQLVGNWVHPANGDWRTRLAGWFDGLGCDAWVLHARTEDAATYAHRRIAESTSDPAEAARLFDEWMAYYERAGIAGLGFGVITLRKSTRPTMWFRCDLLPEIAGSCGAAIEHGFTARDFLAAHADDRSLLNARVRRADGLRWDRQSGLAASGWTTTSSRLRLTSGLMFAGVAEAGVAEFVARCSGATRLGDDFACLATELRRDRAQFTPAFLAVIRRLIEVGILLPVETG